MVCYSDIPGHLHQKDQDIRALCDDKMKLITDLLEVFAKEEITFVSFSFHI